LHTIHSHSQIILLTKSKLDQSRPMVVERNDKARKTVAPARREKNGVDEKPVYDGGDSKSRW
jgi:hypothetical protein